MIHVFVENSSSWTDAFSKFAPALAALIIAVPTLLISFKVYRAAEKNLRKGIELQERNNYLKEARSKLSLLLGAASDLHYHILIYKAHDQLLRGNLKSANFDLVKEKHQKETEILDRLTSDFNLNFHAFLIIMNSDDDPNHILEEKLTSLYKALRTTHDNPEEISALKLEVCSLARDFGKKSCI